MATAAGSDTEETILKKTDPIDDDTSETIHSDDLEGFTYEFVDELRSKEYECPICLHVVRKPLQIPCGDIACTSCWSNWARKQKSKNEEVSCPLCRDPVGTRPVVEAKFLARLVRNLQVYCINYTNGCQGSFPLSDIEQHQALCGFQFVTCELDCGQMLLSNQHKHHMENDCPRRLTTCPFCQSECDINKFDFAIQRKKLDEHHKTHVSQNIQKLTTTVFDLCSTIGISPNQEMSSANKFPDNLTNDICQTSDNIILDSQSESLSLISTIKRQEKIISSIIEASNKQSENITSLEFKVKQQSEKIKELDRCENMLSLEQQVKELKEKIQSLEQCENMAFLEQHVKQQNEKIMSLEQKIDEQCEKINVLDQSENIAAVHQVIKQHNEKVESLEQITSKHSESIHLLDTQKSKQCNKLTGLEYQTEKQNEIMTVLQQQIKQQGEKIKSLEGVSQTLTGNITSLGTHKNKQYKNISSLEKQTVKQNENLTSLKQQINEQGEKIKVIEQTGNTLEQQVKQHDEKIKSLQAVTAKQSENILSLLTQKNNENKNTKLIEHQLKLQSDKDIRHKT